MKKRFFVCITVATLALFLSVGSVFAQPNTGFYFGFSGGFVIPQTMRISDPDNSANYIDTTLTNGYLVGVTTGWHTPFTRKIMAMEIEYNYMFGTDFDKNKILETGETFDGTIGVHALMFNLKARYPEGPIHPYAGAGLGWSYFQVGDITARSGGSVVDIMPGSSGNAFCWQLMTGVDFDIAPNMSLGVGYKYFAANPTIGERYGSGIYADFDYRASIITMGLTFVF
ncbi:MAG: outer membrane beta-barrel protein [Deltaproteobacteria bacterium]|nr:outer membrane beta-barrel protein [Deltaproteobacteria bacterium]